MSIVADSNVRMYGAPSRTRTVLKYWLQTRSSKHLEV